VAFSWAGGDGAPEIAGLASLGYVDFARPKGRKTMSSFGLPGELWEGADANPPQSSRRMAWGLVPVLHTTEWVRGIPSNYQRAPG